MHTLLRYKRQIIYGIVAIAVSATLVARYASSRKAKGGSDFLQAPHSLSQGSIDELETILKRHSELHAKYDGPLAQYFMQHDQPEMAMLYAEQMLGRTSSYATAYADFAETSLMIAHHEYALALSRALSLQQELAKEEESLLKFYNLLRIALLQQELGDQNAEKEAWGQLLHELSDTPSSTQQTFLDSLHEGNISLIDYANSRL